jgi:hypothetical protein
LLQGDLQSLNILLEIAMESDILLQKCVHSLDILLQSNMCSL